MLIKVSFMFANSKYMEEIVHFFSFDRSFNALIAVNMYGFWTRCSICTCIKLKVCDLVYIFVSSPLKIHAQPPSGTRCLLLCLCVRPKL